MGKEMFASVVVGKQREAIGADGAKYASNTPVKAQEAIAEAITEYLVANTTVEIAYNGTLNTGTGADPITVDSMKVSGKCEGMGKPSDYETWVKKVQEMIAKSFVIVSPGVGGIVTTFKPFNATVGALKIRQDKLRAAYKSTTSDYAQAVWEVVCGEILDWLNSDKGKNPTAKGVAATRTGISTGVASLERVTVV